jgi:Zinc finger, C3HC4 type (RING finger)
MAAQVNQICNCEREIIMVPFDIEDQTCCICLEAASSCFLVPCSHNSFCSRCLRMSLRECDKCPLCRTAIQQVHGRDCCYYISRPTLDKAARLAININEVGDADLAIRNLEWEDFLAIIRRDEDSRSLLAEARILIMTSWPSVANRAMEIIAEHPLVLL